MAPTPEGGLGRGSRWEACRPRPATPRACAPFPGARGVGSPSPQQPSGWPGPPFPLLLVFQAARHPDPQTPSRSRWPGRTRALGRRDTAGETPLFSLIEGEAALTFSQSLYLGTSSLSPVFPQFKSQTLLSVPRTVFV